MKHAKSGLFGVMGVVLMLLLQACGTSTTGPSAGGTDVTATSPGATTEPEDVTATSPGATTEPEDVTATSPGATTESEPEQPPADATSLTMWLPPTADDALAFAKGFEETDANVTIDAQTIPLPYEQNVLAKWASGERPDLLYFHGIGNWLVQLNPGETLADLSDMDFVSQTLPGLLENTTEFDGAIYGAVLDSPAVDGVFYNTDVFEELGLDAPEDFDGLLQLCSEISNADVIPVDMAGSVKSLLQIPPIMLLADAINEQPDLIERLNRNETQFTDPVFLEAYAGLQRMMDEGCFNEDVATSTFEQTTARLMSGEAAMAINLSLLVPYLADQYGAEELEKIGFFPVSLTSDLASWQMSNLAVYVPNGPQTDTAKAFVDWATGPAYQGYVDETKQYPVLEGFTTPEGISNALVEAHEAFETNSVPIFQQNLKAHYGTFEDYLSAMLFEGQTPEWVGDQMQSAFERSAQQIGLDEF